MGSEIRADTAADVWQVGAREKGTSGGGGRSTVDPVAAAAPSMRTGPNAGEGDDVRKDDVPTAIG